MKQICLFLFLVVVTGLTKTVRLDDIKYGSCGNSSSNSTFDKFSVQPHPIAWARGQKFNVSAQFTLDETIPEGANISIRLERQGLIPLPVPCDFVDWGFNTSSW